MKTGMAKKAAETDRGKLFKPHPARKNPHVVLWDYLWAISHHAVLLEWPQLPLQWSTEGEHDKLGVKKNKTTKGIRWHYIISLMNYEISQEQNTILLNSLWSIRFFN